MRQGKWALAGAGLLFAAVLASAPQGRAAAPADAAEVIAGRQAAFRLSAALFGSIKGAIDRGDDVTKQAFAARAIAGWAKALPGMFPAGSTSPDSDALPNIWTDRPGFEAKAAAYAAEAGKLAELAKAGDAAGFAAQWTVVRGACSACHDVYRKPQQ